MESLFSINLLQVKPDRVIRTDLKLGDLQLSCTLTSLQPSDFFLTNECCFWEKLK